MWNKIKQWAKRLKDKVTNNLKNLGRKGAILCIILALVLLLTPSIYFVILYIATSNGAYLASAIAWPTFLIAPAGGTGTLLFTICLIVTTTIGIKIKGGKYEAKKELNYKRKEEDKKRVSNSRNTVRHF